jgi:hypothetical protein
MPKWGFLGEELAMAPGTWEPPAEWRAIIVVSTRRGAGTRCHFWLHLAVPLTVLAGRRLAQAPSNRLDQTLMGKVTSTIQ